MTSVKAFGKFFDRFGLYNWQTQVDEVVDLLNNVTIASPLPVGFSPTSTNLDAFGRLRTSTPSVLGFGSFEYGVNALTVETKTNGGGAITQLPDESSIKLQTGASTNGNYAFAQTKMHHRYIPGRSQLIRFSGSFGTPTANVRQRAGYFSDTSGLFIEYTGTTLNFVRRSSTSGSPVDVPIARSAWSDPMDGSGPSGINLDLTKTWLCWIDLEWLGVGRYRFGFASPSTGELVTCYAAAGTNVLAVPYMTTANLPVRFEIENTASAADITMKWICYSVDSEGGDEGQLPIQNSISSGLTATALANGSYRPILAIRAATVMGGGAIRNRGLINPISIDVLNTGNGPISVQVWLNPTTLTQNGGAITWANAGNLAQYAAFTDVDDTVAGGTLRDNFFVTASAQNKGIGNETFHQRIPLVYTLLNSVQDTLVVTAAGIGATPTAFAAMTWTERW